MDQFESHATTLIAPARNAVEIPADDTALPQITRAIYVGRGGDLVVETAGGDEVRFRNLPAGSLLPLRVVRVVASGTTAGGVIGLW